MLANPLKGEVKVAALGRDLTFVLTFAAQKVVAAHFGRRFRDVLAEMDDLDDAQLGYMFWAGFQHHHPDLIEADTDLIVSEIGVPRMIDILAEGVRLAYDAPPLEGVSAGGPRRARRSVLTSTTSAAASSSGSASA